MKPPKCSKIQWRYAIFTVTFCAFSHFLKSLLLSVTLHGICVFNVLFSFLTAIVRLERLSNLYILAQIYIRHRRLHPETRIHNRLLNHWAFIHPHRRLSAFLPLLAVHVQSPRFPDYKGHLRPLRDLRLRSGN